MKEYMKFKRILGWTMIYIAIIVAFIGIGGCVFMNQTKFGKAPSGDRLERIKKSPNYKDGAFHNIRATPMMSGSKGMSSALFEILFGAPDDLKPKDTLPSEKHNLKNIDIRENIIVWFGHSSYYIQIDGKRILVDPVFSPNASPVWFTTKAFPGSNRYSANDMPNIDYLFITHDHWDHLDYATVSALKSKIAKAICPLGVGETLEYWGYSPDKITERDWYDSVDLSGGFSVTLAPTRHFSGRALKRNQTLWTAYMLSAPSMKFYLGGDGGYDKHFAELGEKFGPFDLAILENGQYNNHWKYIHCSPDETMQAAIDLKAKYLFPVHSAKFPLANHPWNEPLKRISKLSEDKKFPIITPKIGQITSLNNMNQSFNKWWEK
jgi:L-ascorbate metabolism protein UlaG (beta-lactamase superfamily)